MNGLRVMVLVLVMLAACSASEYAHARWIPHSGRGRIFAPLIVKKDSASVAAKIAVMPLHETAALLGSGQTVSVQGWEVVSERVKRADGTESSIAYPKTILDEDVDQDGESEVVRLHTYLEMDMTSQQFHIFRLHFRAEVVDPGSVQERDALIEKAAQKAKTKDVNLFEFASLHLPNQTFYDPSQDYRYYLNDDGVFYVKNWSADAYLPVRTEVVGDTMSWASGDVTDMFTKATFTSASLEDLVGGLPN